MTVRRISLAVCAAALVLAGCGDDDKGANKTSDLSPDQWAAELCSLGDGIEPDASSEPASADLADVQTYFVDTYRQFAERLDTFADQAEELGDPPIDGGAGFASAFAAETREFADSLEEAADKIAALEVTDEATFIEEFETLGLDDSMSDMEDPLEADYPEVKKLIDEKQPDCAIGDQQQQ